MKTLAKSLMALANLLQRKYSCTNLLSPFDLFVGLHKFFSQKELIASKDLSILLIWQMIIHRILFFMQWIAFLQYFVPVYLIILRLGLCSIVNTKLVILKHLDVIYNLTHLSFSF